MKLFAIVILLILNSNTSFGSMPGSGPEKAEPRCTLMGQVTKIDLNAQQASVTLAKKTFGSSTEMGCLETNAEKMIGQIVSVSLILTLVPA